MSNIDLKVVLLGSECVGKTSLLERFVHDRFKNTPYQNTIGAAFAAKKVDSNEVQLIMGIWDTAGSERYEAMSSLYYRGAKAAVVCFDPSNKSSWDRAKFWVSELRRVEESCKIYICATKKDLYLESSVDGIDRLVSIRYANGLQAHYFETSSKSGENVSELFQRIADDFTMNPNNLQKLQETINIKKPEKTTGCCW